MIGRVSTFGLGTTMMNATLSVQSKYAETASQKASGLVAATYGELGGDASALLSTEDAVTRQTTWQSNTNSAVARTKSMYSAVGHMIERLTSFRAKLSAAKSDPAAAAALPKTGQDLMNDLASQMNQRLENRYLFAGSRTSNPPVDTSKLSAPASPSTADTSYYGGDSESATARVSDQQTISYGISADATGFETALRAANVAMHFTASPLDTTALNEAYDLATQALSALTDTQSGLSNVSSRLEAAAKEQTESLDLLKALAGDIKNVDLAQVTVRLSQYDAQLQASYSALSKISQFSLAKYL